MRKGGLQGWLDSIGKLGAAIGTLVTLLLVLGYAGLSAQIDALGFAGDIPDVPSPLEADADPRRCLVFGPYWIRQLIFGLLCLNVLLLGVAMRGWWRRLQRWRQPWLGVVGLLICALGLTIALTSVPVVYGKLFLPDEYPWVDLRPTGAPPAEGALVQGWLVIATPDALGLWIIGDQTPGPARLGVVDRSAVNSIEIVPERRQSLAQLVAPELQVDCNQRDAKAMLKRPLLPAFVLLVIGAGLALARAETTTVLSQNLAQTATRLPIEQWQGFFAAAKAGLDDLLRVVETLPRSFRGDEDEAHGATDGETTGDIWSYDLTTDTSQRLTNDGGYRSPQGSANGQWVCFLRHGHLGIMRRDGSALRTFEAGGLYHQLVSCRMDTGEAMLADVEGRIFLMSLEDGMARQVVPTLDDSQPIELNRLIALSRLAPDGRQVYVRSGEGIWRVLVNRRDYLEPKVLLSRSRPIDEPSWTASGAQVLFVMRDT